MGMGTERMMVRYKKASAPLDETAKERLWSSAPLRYEEEAAAELADLVESFYEGARGDERNWGRGFGSDRGECREMLEAVLSEAGADLVAEWVRVEVEDDVKVVGSGVDEVKRRVVGRLRDKGYDAGLCKSQWNRTSRLPTGYHEYIDILTDAGTRYIVEINLAGEFEIARPTDKYQSLLRTIPKLFVAKPDILRGLINVMCIAAKESIKDAGMHIPPWRTREYMQEKWFSSFKRTEIASKKPMVCESLEEGRGGAATRSTGLSTRKFCRLEVVAGLKGARNGKLQTVAFR